MPESGGSLQSDTKSHDEIKHDDSIRPRSRYYQRHSCVFVFRTLIWRVTRSLSDRPKTEKRGQAFAKFRTSHILAEPQPSRVLTHPPLTQQHPAIIQNVRTSTQYSLIAPRTPIPDCQLHHPCRAALPEGESSVARPLLITHTSTTLKTPQKGSIADIQ